MVAQAMEYLKRDDSHGSEVESSGHLARMLLRAGADPSLRDGDGKTPLEHIRQRSVRVAFLGLLAEFGHSVAEVRSAKQAWLSGRRLWLNELTHCSLSTGSTGPTSLSTSTSILRILAKGELVRPSLAGKSGQDYARRTAEVRYVAVPETWVLRHDRRRCTGTRWVDWVGLCICVLLVDCVRVRNSRNTQHFLRTDPGISPHKDFN